ncbi:MAG: hypothetical protein WDA07_01450 [Leucobacter sp.]
MTDIYGDFDAMHGDSAAMLEKQDRLQAMVKQLGSMLETAATGMKGKGEAALQRVGADLQLFGSQQAQTQGDHADKMNTSVALLDQGDDDTARYIDAVENMTVT